MSNVQKLKQLAKLVRYYSLFSSTVAGSGHPTSSLSAADLMTGLFWDGFFRFDLDNPQNSNNDRLIFSKGHASPLFYALWVASADGKLTEKDLETFRKFGSRLEGHPTTAFEYTEAATGSLGQGLSIGVGMAINAKYLDKLPYRTFVLLGDSEMAEGSVWEAMQIAAHYKLDNLIAIVDVNRLGQRGETMYGHDLENYKKKAEAFGWEVIVIDGHNFNEIKSAFEKATSPTTPSSSTGEFTPPQAGGEKPVMIIAKTIKGKGISFLEDKEGWHGKALSSEEFKKAVAELEPIDKKLRGEIKKPEKIQIRKSKLQITNKISPFGRSLAGRQSPNYEIGEEVATRKAYGDALVRIAPAFPNLVALDGEVSNSTYSEQLKKAYPEKFFEMYIAEQNMVSAALGLSRRGKIPFVSTFAAFLSRAFDQIRMSQYSGANIKFVGSHAGVSIGEDGPSQMGLEDIAMFRAISNSVVLYPSDAVSCEKLVEAAAKHTGIVYIRTTRPKTKVIYNNNEKFPIGGSKTLRSSKKDIATVVAAGITLYEALRAYEELQKQRINIRVIDLYSIKPLDVKTLQKAAYETKAIITVEDHYPEGGIGEAVASELARISNIEYRIWNLAVCKIPRSGKPEELLDYEGISSKSIINVVRRFIPTAPSGFIGK